MTGSTAERICIVGDSAGANMAVSVAMRLASCGLRQPDAVISIYGGLLVKYTPSPSRILSLMDPLLPLGVVALCLRGNFYVHCIEILDMILLSYFIMVVRYLHSNYTSTSAHKLEKAGYLMFKAT